MPALQPSHELVAYLTTPLADFFGFIEQFVSDYSQSAYSSLLSDLCLNRRKGVQSEGLNTLLFLSEGVLLPAVEQLPSQS